jgi:hypothetical protein
VQASFLADVQIERAGSSAGRARFEGNAKMEGLAAGFVALLGWLIQTASDTLLLVLVALVAAGIWAIFDRWKRRKP